MAGLVCTCPSPGQVSKFRLIGRRRMPILNLHYTPATHSPCSIAAASPVPSPRKVRRHLTPPPPARACVHAVTRPLAKLRVITQLRAAHSMRLPACTGRRNCATITRTSRESPRGGGVNPRFAKLENQHPFLPPPPDCIAPPLCPRPSRACRIGDEHATPQ